MIRVYDDIYLLPKIDMNGKRIEDLPLDEQEMSQCTFDHLFMWSILLFSGKEADFELIKYYFSFTTHPIICALAAINVYKRLYEVNYISKETKERILEGQKYILSLSRND